MTALEKPLRSIIVFELFLAREFFDSAETYYRATTARLEVLDS